MIEACFYEPSAARVKADLHDVKRRLRGAGVLRGIVVPLPDLEAKGEFLAAMGALGAGGVREELPVQQLGPFAGRQSRLDRRRPRSAGESSA